MQGVITLRDVVVNVRVIVQEFGGMCLVRCLFAAFSRRRTTFLEVAFRRH
jgi:hypothetical protein